MTAGQSTRQCVTETDSVVSVLACTQRQAILRSLDDAGGDKLGVDTLVEQVTDRLRDDESVHIPRRHLRTELYHVHIPKLEAAEMIDYDAETSMVRDLTDKQTHTLLGAIESATP